MYYNTIDADIRALIYKWQKKGKEPKYIVMNTYRYDDFCAIMNEYLNCNTDNPKDTDDGFLKFQFLGLDIVVVDQGLHFEPRVALSPHEMFIAEHRGDLTCLNL